MSDASQPQKTTEFIEKELFRALAQPDENGQTTLVGLCQGYAHELRLGPAALHDETLRQNLYENATQYLFRLLILLHADARGLLRPETHRTLAEIRAQIINAAPAQSDIAPNDYDLWERLDAPLSEIDVWLDGLPTQSSTPLKNKSLSPLLGQLLASRQPDGWRCVINYQEINLRHLGTLHEVLLGQKLVFNGQGKLRINHNASERKSSGAYYTPEYIIAYLLEQTLGQRLNALKSEFFGQVSETLRRLPAPQARSELEEKTQRWLREKVLSITVLDPSMGSGHFLLGAANFIADFISQFLADLGLEAQNFGDPAFWRRQAVEHCLYGMDLDPQAVHLTQASLWMMSMDRNLPSAALRDHFRYGNALTEDAIHTLGRQPGYDIVIGNPPWGANLNASRAHLNLRYETTSKDSAAYFLERAARLTRGELAFIVPKSIAFYNGWQSIRAFLLREMRLSAVLDAGIAFPQVNLESVALVFTKREPTRPDPEIYHALPIKKFSDPKIIHPQGRFDAEIIDIDGIIPLIGLSAIEAQIIKKLHRHALKIGEVASEIYRGLYIPDTEKARLQPGPYAFINKVPDVKRYHLEKIWQIDLSGYAQWRTKIEKIMRPRLFFKVLRGNRLVCYPDSKGEYLTTEKLVNLRIDPAKYPVSYEFLAGALNTSLPSFYIQRVLFSKTTETSRVMDEPYLKHLILPRLSNEETHQSLVAQVAANVRQLIGLNAEIRQAGPEGAQEIKAEIARLDAEIERIVCALFGLSEAEIHFLNSQQ